MIRSWVLAVVLAACASAPTTSSVDDALEQLYRDPRARAMALELAFDTECTCLRSMAESACRDPTFPMPGLAWRALIRSAPDSRASLVAEGLRSNNWTVQLVCAGAVIMHDVRGRDVVAALRDLIHVGPDPILMARCTSALAMVGDEEDMDWLYHVVEQPQWSHCLEAFSMRPRKSTAEAFESLARADDPDTGILARRALARLNGDPIPDEMTKREWSRSVVAACERLGSARSATWREMIRSIVDSRVLIFGEHHGVSLEQAWAARIMSELLVSWPGTKKVICERPMMELQDIIAATGRMNQLSVGVVEDSDDGREVGKRDRVAAARVIDAIKQDPELRIVMQYGASHLLSLSKQLRDAGVPVTAIALGPLPGMLGRAIRAKGDLEVGGEVFSFGEGLWLVVPGSLGVMFGNAFLDDVVDELR